MTSLEPAIDPNNRITFLLDWELTMKCNLDCDYCSTGIYGGHDNSTKHPPLAQCLDSIDFMFEYVDLYMSQRTQGLKYVVLNVYGGESLHHPNIQEILQQVRDRQSKYSQRWHLTVTTTTNAIITGTKLQQIIPLIDEFTVSYHTNNTAKQKQLFRDNLLRIKAADRRLKCVVLMHAEPELFQDAQEFVQWLADHNIKHLPRQLDHLPEQTEFNYNKQQVHWFQDLYNNKSNVSKVELPKTTTVDLTHTGRACCGGRQLCADQNYRSREFFVGNKFPDWHCSVNHFFLYVKQVNGEIYTNKDCKMDFKGNNAPIGNLSATNELLQQTRDWLATNTMPVIQCKNTQCYCGLCAPKAPSLDTYKTIMRKYEIPNTDIL